MNVFSLGAWLTLCQSLAIPTVPARSDAFSSRTSTVFRITNRASLRRPMRSSAPIEGIALAPQPGTLRS